MPGAKAPTLRQPGDGLVDDRRKDGGCDVVMVCALVEQRLNVRLCEHAAARSDGIKALGARGVIVHLLRSDIQQGGHLINKGAGAAGAGAVHAHLQPVFQEENFGVLAAQLNGGIGVGQTVAQGDAGRKNLLHKRDAALFGQPHARRARNCQHELILRRKALADCIDEFGCFFRNLRIVALIRMIDNVVIRIEHHTFYSRRAYINTNSHLFHPHTVIYRRTSER
ncbi:hypothetical protein DSECCO2_662630 [anaerobic digester metagenome]